MSPVQGVSDRSDVMLTALIHGIALVLIAATVLLVGVVPIYAAWHKEDADIE
jgi:hypothetical protein